MGAHLGRHGFIIPQTVLLDYAEMCLIDIAELALDVAVVGLRGPASEDSDGVVSRVQEKSLTGGDGGGTRRVW